MKIMLIRPRPSRETIGLQHVMICEPLELEYLCSGIGDLGHETMIVDMILEKAGIETFLLDYQPDVVAITGYITHVGIIKEYCRKTKELLPDCYTIVGGVHAEVVPWDFEDECIDFVVSSNGIASFRQIVAALSEERDPSDVAGLWSQDHPPCEKNTSFDHPFPDRSKVQRYRSKYYYLFHNPCALIKTSFGCPYSCEFCFCREITGGQYFERSIDSVIDELKTIPEKDIYIVDDNFLVSRERILEFCRRLDEERLHKKFLIYGRADFIAANEDVIAGFKRRGLRAVIVGLESCNANELEEYNKKNDVMANETAVRMLAEHGIDCYATLILGMDWSRTDFRRLGRWLRNLKLTFINLQPFTPLPGTAMLAKYEDGLIVPREDYEKWDLAHLVLAPAKMSAARYYWNIIRLYYGVTMRPVNLIRLLFRHGPAENLRMLLGSSRVTFQYLRRMIGSWKSSKKEDPSPHIGEVGGAAPALHRACSGAGASLPADAEAGVPPGECDGASKVL